MIESGKGFRQERGKEEHVRTAKHYSHWVAHTFRPEQEYCLDCQHRLRRAHVISRRTIITLKEVLRLTHWGYRCPNSACSGGTHLYRSTIADQLALPGFTFGLDIVLLVGVLRLQQHKTIDEVHQELTRQLSHHQVTISRREILFLFETYTALLRAGTEVSEDAEWKRQTQTNGGLILSIDGIQPDKGNETIYLIREVLTGRLLLAENVTSTRKEVLIRLLKEVKALGQPIVGVISDAQETLRQAVAELWPEAPHQLCHFHALREASRPLFALDHTTRTQVRKSMQKQLRAFQADTQCRFPHSEKQQSQQLGVLDAYASAIQVAINSDGLAPFHYAGLSMDEALCDLQESLARLEKKEGVNQTCTNRLRRLARILHETEAQRKPFQQIRRMREWLLEIERILAGDWAANLEEVTQVAVNQQLDAWQARLEVHVQTDAEHSEEARCLSYLLKVVTDLKPWLTHCYAHANLPRTNNAMELLIRAIKTRYRRYCQLENRAEQCAKIAT